MFKSSIYEGSIINRSFLIKIIDDDFEDTIQIETDTLPPAAIHIEFRLVALIETYKKRQLNVVDNIILFILNDLLCLFLKGEPDTIDLYIQYWEQAIAEYAPYATKVREKMNLFMAFS